MRSAFLCLVGTFAVLGFTNPSIISAQDLTEDARRRLSNGVQRGNTGTGASVVTPSTQVTTRTVVTYITYLTKERQWKADDGRTMTGRLVAFSAPKPNEQGQVVVIKDGKVRLRPTGAKGNSDVPLTKLSSADQTFIQALNSGIQKSRERDAKKTAASEGE